MYGSRASLLDRGKGGLGYFFVDLIRNYLIDRWTLRWNFFIENSSYSHYIFNIKRKASTAIALFWGHVRYPNPSRNREKPKPQKPAPQMDCGWASVQLLLLPSLFRTRKTMPYHNCVAKTAADTEI